MKKLKSQLPPIGLRNLKTALGVFICILLYDLLHRPYVFFAGISVVSCLSTTMESSYQMSKDRMIGTVMGGLIGVPFLYLKNLAAGVVHLFVVEGIIVGVGIVVVIYLLNLMNDRGAIVNGCIVFLSVVIALEDGVQHLSPVLYSLNRVIDSAVGIIVALAVNKYFFPFENRQNMKSNDFN